MFIIRPRTQSTSRTHDHSGHQYRSSYTGTFAFTIVRRSILITARYLLTTLWSSGSPISNFQASISSAHSSAVLYPHSARPIFNEFGPTGVEEFVSSCCSVSKMILCMW